MATLHLPPDFAKFLKLLNAHRVKYLLIGGYAIGFHGYPRATADMDIWVPAELRNAEKLTTLLKKWGVRFAGLTPELFLKKDCVVQIGIPPMRLDIANSASGVRFDECYRDRQVATIDGTRVKVISLKHLKKNKRACGRHKDLNDLENLP
jgi:hypothetical protein